MTKLKEKRCAVVIDGVVRKFQRTGQTEFCADCPNCGSTGSAAIAVIARPRRPVLVRAGCDICKWSVMT